MPVCERDPWRFQFFEDVSCPQDVNIPTDDIDSYAWYPSFRWVYDKLQIARTQGLACGMAGHAPPAFPVFAKPNVNLRGMGLESAIVHTQGEFENLPPGHMWMPLLQGEHISTDCAIINGDVKWMRHAMGFPWIDGMFTHWVIENEQRTELNDFLSSWIARHMHGYTGMMNFETIGGAIIEAHLRFADQWCDLYGREWFDALVKLYAHGTWNLQTLHTPRGYSIPLFAHHGHVPPFPPDKLQRQIRTMPHISSLQLTYDPARPEQDHPMPPGGFRLGLINCTDLRAGIEARQMLVQGFPHVHVMLPELTAPTSWRIGRSVDRPMR
jgi:hypothetical protein